MGDKNSFESVKTWMIEIDKYALETVNKVLVGNKSDLNQLVSQVEAQQLADQYKMDFIQCSAMTGHNINLVFQNMGASIMKRTLPTIYKTHTNPNPILSN